MYLGNDLSRGRSTLYYFDASGSETSITTATRPNVTISYTVGWVAVYLNGVRLHDSDFTADTGNSITDLAALVAGDVVIIEAAHVFSVANTVPATGGTFTGNVTMDANLTVSGTTTTIDTAVTVSDSMVVNNAGSDVGVKVNSTSTGNILQLQDNAVDVFVVADGGDISTGTTNKIKQKGAFTQSSTHQALTLGG